MTQEASDLALKLQSLARKGDFAGATALARQYAAHLRSDAKSSFISGLAFAMVGDYKSAAASFKIVLSLDPTHIAARGALARALILSGDAAGAQTLIDQLAHEANTAPEAAENLIDAYLQAGRAEDAYQAALRADARYGGGRFLPRLGEAALRTRRRNVAFDAAARAEKRFGMTPAVLNIAGPAAIMKDDDKCLSAMTARINAFAPERAAAIFDFWTSVLMAGDFLREARKSAELAAGALPSAARWRLVSDLRLADRDARGAEIAARNALELEPSDAAAMTLLARCRLVAGEDEEAKRLLIKASEIEPSCAAAFDNLAQIDANAISEAMANILESNIYSKRFSPDDEAKALLALARRDEARGEFQGAFDRIIAAKKLLSGSADAAGRGYNPAKTDAVVNTMLRRFPAPFKSRKRTRPDARPIFVVGMPRSGTSLVEQILASHARVYGVGEAPGMQLMLDEFLAAPDLSFVDGAAQEDLSKRAERYLGALPKKALASAAFVDKHPLNFWCVGLIRAILPDAGIVLLKRPAIDTCLSILRLRFFASYDFANSIDAVAHYYAAHLKMTAHWRALFADAIHEIEYNELTTSPEKTIRGLLDYCGLEFDPSCLKFYETPRNVITHSAAQVRKPMNQTASERRAKYAGALKPLEDALSRFGVATR
ncbi:MAG: sulfotransferase [Parvularculaceae bacterium]|nr:sulfotransferase [Parvularculaceae bacterium]